MFIINPVKLPVYVSNILETQVKFGYKTLYGVRHHVKMSFLFFLMRTITPVNLPVYFSNILETQIKFGHGTLHMTKWVFCDTVLMSNFYSYCSLL